MQPAHLEWHNSEAKWRAKEPPKRVIVLKVAVMRFEFIPVAKPSRFIKGPIFYHLAPSLIALNLLTMSSKPKKSQPRCHFVAIDPNKHPTNIQPQVYQVKNLVT